MEIHYTQILAISLYLAILIGIGYATYKKDLTSSDFIIGGRKMNFWLTALAAHVSDMSSWIFTGYPAQIFLSGLHNIWIGVGLVFFMFLNWHFVAPRLRKETEKYESLTLSSYFEGRFHDRSGLIRLSTALISFFFFTIYIAGGLIGLGLLLETLFGCPYNYGIFIGMAIVIPYLFMGGFITLAWTDLVQGIFLLLVIIGVPIYVISLMGWTNGILPVLNQKSTLSFFSSSSFSYWEAFFLFCSWGLGYYGQPQILTKFMGIKNPQEIPKSKYIGISWQILTLAGATFIGLVAVAYFPEGLKDSEKVFINMTSTLFYPFFATFILSAIIGATITSMDAQILVVASSIAEDFYKKWIHKEASSKEILLVTRLSIFFIAFLSIGIAILRPASIFTIISYPWFGLGSSFGPLVIFSLFSKKVNRFGAWGGILVGGFVSALWPLLSPFFPIAIPSLIPGFFFSSLAIYAISLLTQQRTYDITHSTR